MAADSQTLSEYAAFLAAGWQICEKEEKQNAFGKIRTSDLLLNHSLTLKTELSLLPLKIRVSS